MSTPRRLKNNFWREHVFYAQLKGIGGPGAPHLFELKRFGDSGVIG